MGRSHALSGAVVWLAGCAAAGAVGEPPSAPTVVVGAVVTAGAALLPDMDHPGATVAHALGPATRTVAAGISRLGDWLRDRTCGCCTTSSRGGHRTITHTAVGAVAAGGLAALLGGFGGVWSAGGLVLFMSALAVRGLLRRRWRGRWVALTVGVVAAVAAVAGGGDSWWWLGLPVGVGCLTHIAGDGLTLSGVPVCWPLRVRGCRWYRCGTPRRLRFRTGGLVELRLVVPLLLAAGAGSVWVLI